MSIQKILKTFILCLCFTSVMQASTSHATVTYDITLNTSSLIGSSLAPYTLDFVLTDGSGLGNANNTITIQNFSFGASPISLTDTSFFNEALVPFIPLSSSLSFKLVMTTNSDTPAPDSFTFGILDSSLKPIPTLNPLLADNFLAIDLDSPTGTVMTSGTDLARTNIQIDSPSVTNPSSVPEPATLFLLTFSLAGVGIVRRFQKSA